MGKGIQICGLNGCGKSTIGRALSERLGFHFIDNENLYFPRTYMEESYGNPRTRAEVETLLIEEVQNHENFVFAAVRGDYGKEITSLYDYIVIVKVPEDIRLKRVRDRSFQKFGNRMMPGGDLYKQEEAFFRMAESRQDDYVENWLKTLSCPVIRVDGTRPVDENVERIVRMIKP